MLPDKFTYELPRFDSCLHKKLVESLMRSWIHLPLEHYLYSQIPQEYQLLVFKKPFENREETKESYRLRRLGNFLFILNTEIVYNKKLENNKIS